MASITGAYNDVLAACNDPYIGYSQPKRTTIRLGVNYRTYCDCSSLISWALTRNGFFSQNPWFRTYQMDSILTGIGFQKLSATSNNWQNGDIMWKSGHTEMVYDAVGGTKGVCMGAHSDGYAFDYQVSVSRYTTNGSFWTYIYRWPEGATPGAHVTWHQVITDAYGALTADEKYDNAILTYYALVHMGFTDEAAAGVMGNIQAEGDFNPGQWEHGFNMAPSSGYGMFQYTPSTKYTDYATIMGVDISDPDQNGPCQIQWLDDHPSQWNASAAGYSYDAYKQLTDERAAAIAWMLYWERPASTTPAQQQARADNASYWLNEIQNNFPSDPGGEYGYTDWHWMPGMLNCKKRRKYLR